MIARWRLEVLTAIKGGVALREHAQDESSALARLRAFRQRGR